MILGLVSVVSQIMHGLQEADNIPQLRVHVVEAGSHGPCEDRVEGMEYESQYDAQYDDMRADIQEVKQLEICHCSEPPWPSDGPEPSCAVTCIATVCRAMCCR